MSTTKISKDVLDLLVKTMASSGASDLENAKQVIEASGYADSVVAPVLKMIDEQLEAIQATKDELKEILDREDVKSHITQLLDAKEAELTDKVNEAAKSADEAAEALKSTTVDAIVHYSIVLHKDSIDTENVEASIKSLKDELTSKSQSELNDSLKELQDEVYSSFCNTPSTTIDNETQVEDGANNDPDSSNDSNEDNEDTNKDEVPHSLSDVLARFLSGVKSE